jgi:hypothetical protein
VNGTTRTTLGIVSGSSDIARLILGPTPGTGNYDYCSLIQSESYTAGNYGSKLSFWTHPNAGNYGDPTERMRIDQNGLVGINTTTPYYQLDVIGDSRVSGNFYANNALYRNLSATAINQPILQYGETTGSGASGSVTITLPVAYTSSNSYVATASMMDVDPARMSVNRDSASQITIYWFQAGSGSQKLGWNTMGT